MDKALEIAGEIGSKWAAGGGGNQRSVRETEGISEVDGLARELEIGWPIFATNDAARGNAFAENGCRTTPWYVSEAEAEHGPGERLPRRHGPPPRPATSHTPVGGGHAGRISVGRRATRRRRGTARVDEASSAGRPAQSAAPVAKRARHEPGRAGSPASTPRTTSTPPMVGFANPLAPPVEGGPRGKRQRQLRGRPRSATSTRARHLRPRPAHRRGLDETLGISDLLTAQGAMTGTRKIRYRRPTPLLAPLELVARNTGRDGADLRLGRHLLPGGA